MSPKRGEVWEWDGGRSRWQIDDVWYIDGTMHLAMTCLFPKETVRQIYPPNDPYSRFTACRDQWRRASRLLTFALVAINS